MNTRLTALAIAAFFLATTMTVARISSEPRAAAEKSNGGAVLINTCLVTNDIPGMTTFYRHVLQVEPRREGDIYVEFRTGTGVLALFSAAAEEKYIPGSAVAAQNRSAILEFRVNDPDGEYVRLHDFVKWVKGPTTQPWGTRSIYFRDPEGNLVDFFSPPQRP
jgi:catechol 2,3-dioxygenase-like lactoylglutathione lyase family enzyme